MTKVKGCNRVNFTKAATDETTKMRKSLRLSHIDCVVRRWLYKHFEKSLIKNGILYPSRNEINNAIRGWRKTLKF